MKVAGRGKDLESLNFATGIGEGSIVVNLPHPVERNPVLFQPLVSLSIDQGLE